MPTIIQGDFEWDLNKNKTNKAKHGIVFEESIALFDNWVSEQEIMHDSGEWRIIATGKIKHRYITVVYTMRDESKRIISVRAARKEEKDCYDQEIKDDE